MSPTRLIPADFRQLPKNGVRFEALVCQLLEAMGYHVLREPAIGPDGGMDVLIQRTTKDSMVEQTERVVVQCKHYAHSGKYVREKDIGVFQNVLDRYNAQGYLLVTSTYVVGNLSSAFHGFTEQDGRKRWATFWDVDKLIQCLNEYPQVLDTFFPPPALPPETLPLANEVTGFLTAMGFEILEGTWARNRVVFLARRVSAGEYINRWYLCVERSASPDDVSELQERISSIPASQGWIVTPHTIDCNVQRMIETHPQISAYALASFYRQMLQYDHYLRELIGSAKEVEEQWVDLKCILENGSRNLVDYVDEWLDNPVRNHLALSGSFGTGKTWFCRYYAARAARLHWHNPHHHRIPVLISLRGYAKALNIEQLVTATLVDTYRLDLVGGFETFRHLNSYGRLLVILDGFDEMEQRVDYSVAMRNREEVSRLVGDTSKVILTSRPLLAADAAGILKPGFEVISLAAFDDEQIQGVLRKRIPEEWEKCWSEINGIQRLRDLASRPVMTKIISETLPAILKLGHQINGATLYRTYVDEWITKSCKDPRVENKKQDVLGFIRDLAWNMFRSPATGTVAPSDFREHVDKRFRSLDLTASLEKLFEVDKATGNYTFPHISFMEYFVADRIAESLAAEDPGPLFSGALTDGVLEFLVDLFRSEADTASGVLKALASAQPGEQTNALTRLLTRLGNGNPIAAIIEMLKATHCTTALGALSQHMIADLGREEFLEDVAVQSAQGTSPPVDYCLLELWGSPIIESGRALRKLASVIYNEDSDLKARAHAVQVVGRRQGAEDFRTLVEAVDRPELPTEIRQACIENIPVCSLPDDIRNAFLHNLHGVISNDEDDTKVRKFCVIKLAEYGSRKALEPLLTALKNFSHVLWFVAANTISQTSDLDLAVDIERDIILPNEDDHSLIRQVAFLKQAVESIRTPRT